MTTTPDTTAPEVPQRLHWLKYNPSEWQGRCNLLSDAEYGLYHRVVEVLWRTPGNRVSRADLALRLRLSRDLAREAMLDQLIQDQELRLDADGMLDIPFLHEAFNDAVARSENASRGGQRAAANRRARAPH